MKHLIASIFTLFITQAMLHAQTNDGSIKTALLIVDIQQFYFPSDDNPGLVNAEEASLQAQKTLQIFRNEKQEVIHIRHNAKNGFEIHGNVKPINTEKIITKAEVNAFNGTDLLEYLQANKITRLVLIGMQTHMCLEAATRAAYDYGFECIVIEDACATRDLKYGDNTVKAEDVHSSTLATLSGGGYARIINLADFSKNTQKFLYQELK